LETHLGIEISPMCDQRKVVVPTSQMAFINFVVAPWYNAWCNVVPDVGEVCLEFLNNNYNETYFI